jgi:hypothetical protein
MRIVTNEQLAKRNKQIAQYGFLASFLVPVGGLLLLNQEQANTSSTTSLLTGFVLPLLILPVAYLVMMFAIRLQNLWVRQPRPEEVIAEGIKGLSNKSVIYNYCFFPARHLIFAPQGVFAIITRFQDGAYSVNGSKWISHKSMMNRILTIFRMDGMGDPFAEAQRAADHVKNILASIAPDVPVQPLVVCVDPRIQLDIHDPTLPVLHASAKMSPSLKDYLRDVTKEKRLSLTQEQIEAFERANFA